ncbi:hypothetical protein DENSPDRAFT_850685 [Dentipellis sp. KUC8613]|nr:hypothetical protein DENSPDRAFT_850685 [Dentipellis sp. KUC8613]
MSWEWAVPARGDISSQFIITWVSHVLVSSRNTSEEKSKSPSVEILGDGKPKSTSPVVRDEHPTPQPELVTPHLPWEDILWPPSNPNRFPLIVSREAIAAEQARVTHMVNESMAMFEMTTAIKLEALELRRLWLLRQESTRAN